MKKSDVLETIRDVGLIPVLRAPSVPRAMAIARAVIEGGCSVIEVTMTVPRALEVIRALNEEYPEALIGAGTVLDPETARLCMMEGAQFIVSPATNLDTIAICRRYAVAVLPGALTPTEIVAAWQAGADAIKVFPISAVGGAKYLRSLKAALPQIELVPTGGVTLATAEEFLKAGAFALGVGADLASVEAIDAGAPHIILDTARNYRRIVTELRETLRAIGDAARPFAANTGDA